MPYIVTTRREGRLPGKENDASWSRRAVATLDEARGAVWTAIRKPLKSVDHWPSTIPDVPESGGTVGPLPDGTVIEVSKELDWFPIMVGAGISVNDTQSYAEPKILAAFNAKQSA